MVCKGIDVRNKKKSWWKVAFTIIHRLLLQSTTGEYFTRMQVPPPLPPMAKI